MADQWFYTCNGKQMEAVPIAELRKLAASGLVKPTDLVWQEDMPNWIRASAAKGLFEDGGAPRPGPTPGDRDDRSSPSGRRTPDDGGRRRPRRGADYFDQDPDRPGRRPTGDGLSAGAKAAIILGVVLVVVSSVVGGIILLVNSSNDGPRNNLVAVKDKAGAKVGNAPITYTATIHAGNTDARNFEFKANTQYEFHITRDFKGDLDFFIRDQNNFNDMDQWISVPDNHRHNWVAPYTGTFRVELIQMGDRSTKATVTIREIGAGWGKGKVNVPPPVFAKDGGNKGPLVAPAPALGEALSVGLKGITQTGTLNNFDALDPGGRDRSPCHVYLVRMDAGCTYQIDLMSNDFDAFLRLEDGNFFQLAENDDFGGKLDSRILFTCNRTDTYRIVCRPLAGGGFAVNAGRYTLKVLRI